MAAFEFATAARILFGPGTVRQVPALAAAIFSSASKERRALVVLGQRQEQAADFLAQLGEQGFTTTTFTVAGEPTTADVQAGVQQAREAGCHGVISLGGGSVIDAGKAIAALLANGGEPLDYLEVIGRGRPLTRPSTPFIAIPSTAGTGAEVTRNAVLAVPEHKVKVSLRSPHMLPTLAVVDPELTYTMPPEVTASTGLDALTQVMEPYVSSQANPLTDPLCREGIRLAARSLSRAYEDGQDTAARTDMALASLFGGLALANARLGAVHGFAGVLGGLFPAPHGVICARLLPHVMAMNVRALQARAPGSPALARYHEVSQLLTGNPAATTADGVAWVQELCTALHISPLSRYGLTADHFPTVVAQSQKASSMKGNPLPLTDAELTEILWQVV